jgi:hypothetical protein
MDHWREGKRGRQFKRLSSFSNMLVETSLILNLPELLSIIAKTTRVAYEKRKILIQGQYY